VEKDDNKDRNEAAHETIAELPPLETPHAISNCATILRCATGQAWSGSPVCATWSAGATCLPTDAADAN